MTEKDLCCASAEDAPDPCIRRKMQSAQHLPVTEERTGADSRFDSSIPNVRTIKAVGARSQLISELCGPLSQVPSFIAPPALVHAVGLFLNVVGKLLEIERRDILSVAGVSWIPLLHCVDLPCRRFSATHLNDVTLPLAPRHPRGKRDPQNQPLAILNASRNY